VNRATGDWLEEKKGAGGGRNSEDIITKITLKLNIPGMIVLINHM